MSSTVREQKSSYWATYCRHQPSIVPLGIGNQRGRLFLQVTWSLSHRLRNGSLLGYKLRTTPYRTSCGLGRLVQCRDMWLQATSFRQVETKPEVDGSGPLNTQPNGKRTATRVFLRSASRYSSGRKKLNTS